MAVFSRRHICYRIGVYLLFMATALFSVGMALPWWAQSHDDAKSHSGLWLGCSSFSTEPCTIISAPGWLKMVQALQCLGVMGTVLACFYALCVNCCRSSLSHSRVLEVSSGIGGFLGLVGAIVYIVKTHPHVKASQGVTYSWALGLDITGCLLAALVSPVIAASNWNDVDDNKSDYYYYNNGSRRHLTSTMDLNSECQVIGTSRPASGGGVFVVQTNCSRAPSCSCATPACSGSKVTCSGSKVTCSGLKATCSAAMPNCSGPVCACAQRPADNSAHSFQNSCLQHQANFSQAVPDTGVCKANPPSRAEEYPLRHLSSAPLPHARFKTSERNSDPNPVTSPGAADCHQWYHHTGISAETGGHLAIEHRHRHLGTSCHELPTAPPLEDHTCDNYTTAQYHPESQILRLGDRQITGM